MRIAVTLATLLSLASAAGADPKPAPPAAPPAPAERISDDCARARKANRTCVLDIGEEVVDGTIVKNTGIDTTIATFSSHGSLIRIRKDFLAEIAKSAEDL